MLYNKFMNDTVIGILLGFLFSLIIFGLQRYFHERDQDIGRKHKIEERNLQRRIEFINSRLTEIYDFLRLEYEIASKISGLHADILASRDVTNLTIRMGAILQQQTVAKEQGMSIHDLNDDELNGQYSSLVRQLAEEVRSIYGLEKRIHSQEQLDLGNEVKSSFKFFDDVTETIASMRKRISQLSGFDN